MTLIEKAQYAYKAGTLYQNPETASADEIIYAYNRAIQLGL